MTAKQKLFAKIDTLIGAARSTYYVQPLNKNVVGRGKSEGASLASNPLVQLLQSMWMSSGTGSMTGGGGTTGKSALGQALLGVGPIPADWTEANRWQILMDVLTFRSFPSAVMLVAHMGLSALSDTQIRAEASKRWGKKAGTAFVAWHKATVVFLSAISELDTSSPAKKKKASTLPNLSELTGHNKERAKKPKRAAPSAKASEAAKAIAQDMIIVHSIEELEDADDVKGRVGNMAPVK